MPQVIERNCHTCGKPLAPAIASLMLNHPGCDPVPQDLELLSPPITADGAISALSAKVGAVPSPLVASEVKTEITTMLLRFEHNSPRSRQANIGPSEVGVDCDRRLAYRVMGLSGPNEGMDDPWPAFVGSAIHARVEDAIRAYLDAHPHAPKWSIEEWVQADPLIRGRADLNRDDLLVDIKSAGKDVMDEVKKSGPPLKYRVQQMLYAKGLRDKGKMINFICLMFVPRSGWLHDAYVWAEPYDEDLALRYIARPYQLAQRLQELDVQNLPENWEKIPSKPSYECKYCPMWAKYIPQELGANATGCPGWQAGKK